MLGDDLLLVVVEVDEIAGENVHRTDREADRLLVDKRKVDEVLERLLERRRAIEARRGARAGRRQPRAHLVRLEEARLAHGHGHERARGIAHLPVDVTVGGVMPDLAVGDALPEFAQLAEPGCARVAGDDRGVDGAERNPGHPIGLDPVLVQRLVNARLVGAERAASLQDQRNAPAAVRPPTDERIGLGARPQMIVPGHFSFAACRRSRGFGPQLDDSFELTVHFRIHVRYPPLANRVPVRRAAKSALPHASRVLERHLLAEGFMQTRVTHVRRHRTNRPRDCHAGLTILRQQTAVAVSSRTSQPR